MMPHGRTAHCTFSKCSAKVSALMMDSTTCPFESCSFLPVTLILESFFNLAMSSREPSASISFNQEARSFRAAIRICLFIRTSSFRLLAFLASLRPFIKFNVCGLIHGRFGDTSTEGSTAAASCKHLQIDCVRTSASVISLISWHASSSNLFES